MRSARGFGPGAIVLSTLAAALIVFATALREIPYAVAIPTLAFAFVVGFVASREADVSVDEGGVRWRRGRRTGYTPFTRIRNATLKSALVLRGSALVLETDRGEQRFPLGDVPPGDLLGAILSRLGKRAIEVPAEAAALAREGRPLDEWLERVRERGDLGGAYRAGELHADALERLALDERADPELRAAATHVLLARGGEDEAQARRVAFSVGPGAPPIVVIAGAMAAPSRVDPALVVAALPHLDVADRRAFARAGAGAPRVQSTRIRVVVDAGPDPRVDAAVEPREAATEAEEDTPASLPATRAPRAARPPRGG